MKTRIGWKKEGRPFFRLGMLLLLTAFAIHPQEKTNGSTDKGQPSAEAKAPSSKKVKKTTYFLSGSEGYCELIVDDFELGETIKPWARIRNVGNTATCIKEIKETVFGPPSGMKLMDATLDPGKETIYELDSINTEGFLGDLCKTYSLKFDPPAKVEVTIYRSKEDLEKDKNE